MPPKSMNALNTTKSDELASLRQMFSKDGLFGAVGEILQINLVIDANAILADLRWLTCKAKNNNARTNLIEAIDAQTIIAYAPTYLHAEIQKNIPKIAEEEKIEVSLLFEKWDFIKSKINFIEAGGPEDNAIDPKDVPYVNLHKYTGYPILSEDHHISKMGAKTIKINITTYARDYSREAVIEYKIKTGFLSAFVVTSTMINIASKIIRSLLPNIKNIPTWTWIMLIAIFAFAISIDAFRLWLLNKLNDISKKSNKLGKQLFNALSPLVLEHQKRQENANKIKKQIINEISNA